MTTKKDSVINRGECREMDDKSFQVGEVIWGKTRMRVRASKASQSLAHTKLVSSRVWSIGLVVSALAKPISKPISEFDSNMVWIDSKGEIA